MSIIKSVCEVVNQCANHPRQCHRCNRTGIKGKDCFIPITQNVTRLPGVIPKSPVDEKVLA